MYSSDKLCKFIYINNAYKRNSLNMKVSENRIDYEMWVICYIFLTFHLACEEVPFRTGLFSTMSELYARLFYLLMCSMLI